MSLPICDLLLGFYARRIRRLLPALLLFVLVAATALCLVNPDPGQMLGVGWRSLFGSSNLILHKLALEYFRPAIGLNPFAHTWSLAVEEQFYLLWPLVMTLLLKRYGKRITRTAPMMFLASLFIAGCTAAM